MEKIKFANALGTIRIPRTRLMLIVKHLPLLRQALRLLQQQAQQVQLQQHLPQRRVQPVRQPVLLLPHQRKIRMAVLELWPILTFDQTVFLIATMT